MAVADVLGKGELFEFQGESYEVSPWTYDMDGSFERWLRAQAWKEIEDDRDTTPPDVYAERHEAMARVIGAKTFKRGTKEYRQAMCSWDGQQFMFFLMLRARNPAVTLALVDKIARSKYAELAARVEAALRDPNPNAPAAPPAEKTAPDKPTA